MRVLIRFSRVVPASYAQGYADFRLEAACASLICLPLSGAEGLFMNRVVLFCANTLARASLPALAVLGIACLAPEGVLLGQRL
jgi:hypothetical protein